jgi:hypothetical protein
MAFNQIALPANTPAIVRDVICGAVEPYLSDVHAMLMLPLDGSLPHVGCNMAIAHVLFAAISGVSAVLYSTEGYSGQVFQDYLTHFYPWDAEPTRENTVSGAEAARILYEDYRNPLTHATGTPVFSVDRGQRRQFQPRPYTLAVHRVGFPDRAHRGLLEEQILSLESEPVRPGWLPVTIAADSSSRILTVETLYWGFRASLQRLCGDATKMKAAAELFHRTS